MSRRERHSPSRRSQAIGGSRAAASTSIVLFLFCSCAAEQVVPKCSRLDVPSMGPENSFRVSIPAESAPLLAGPGDRVEVAFSIVPPVDGPVTLVHSQDGRETARWELQVGPGSGISTRCRLGATRAESSCNAPIGTLPHSSAGQWSVEPGNNRVLEAGLAFRTCR